MEVTKKAVEVIIMSSFKWILYICIFHTYAHKISLPRLRELSFQIITYTANIDYVCSNTTLRDVTDTITNAISNSPGTGMNLHAKKCTYIGKHYTSK